MTAFPGVGRLLNVMRTGVPLFIGGVISCAHHGRPAEEAYVSAFFDRWVRGQGGPLLDHQSDRYPAFAFTR
jgi:hypothetical protein